MYNIFTADNALFYPPEFRLSFLNLYIVVKLNLRKPASNLAESLTIPGYLKRLQNNCKILCKFI